MDILKYYKDKLIPSKLQFKDSVSSYYNLTTLFKGLSRTYSYVEKCVKIINSIEKDPIHLSHTNTYIVYTTVYLKEFEKFYNEIKYRISHNTRLKKYLKVIEKYIRKIEVMFNNCDLLFTYY